MLKYQVDSLEGLDESLHSLYTQGDNGYTLQVEGVAPAGAVDDLRQKLVDANDEAGRRRRSVEKWKELGESPEAVRELLDAKGKPDADHQAIIDALKADHSSALDAANSRIKDMQTNSAMKDLQAELAKANIIGPGLEPLALMAKSRMGFDDDGNLRIMKDNKPMAGSGSDGYATVSDLAKELAASELGQVFVRDSGSSGGGKPPASGRDGQSKTVTRAQFDGMSQGERASFFKDGGKVTDA